MKLRAPSYLMLGMLRLGARSGYAIKKTVDVSTKHFWPTSLAQVYPELSRLQSAGLVTRSEDPRGARNRSAYELTDEGEAALLAWLRSAREVPPQARDEGMLRLFFADALPRDDQLALIRRLRERDDVSASWIRTEILPLANTADQRAGTRFPAIVARLSADLFAYAADWLATLQSELEAESPEKRPPARRNAQPARRIVVEPAPDDPTAAAEGIVQPDHPVPQRSRSVPARDRPALRAHAGSPHARARRI